jgi:hypothetical protein
MKASLKNVDVKVIALAVALVGLTSAPAMAQAVITNGSGLGLGIKATGAMGVSMALPAEAGAPGGLPANASLVGLSFVANYGSGLQWRDATTPGCMCEGFGVSANGIAGYDGNGFSNLTILDPGGTTVGTSGYQTLVALTSLPGVTIAHDYHPSASPNLYEATVTITNTTAATVTDVRYNRTMDWDVPPTDFNEFVTLKGAGLGDLIDSCDDGFESANPLSDCSAIVAGNEDANFTDVGPFDIGARFTFGFGDLAAGASKTFKIYYGAAGSESAALAALALAGAEGIYSLGQSNGGQTSGAPATFIFGFGGVGAPPIDPDPTAVPEPASMLLIGGGLAGGLFKRLRKKA